MAELPEDRARHDELERSLAERLRTDPDRAIRVRSRFAAETVDWEVVD